MEQRRDHNRVLPVGGRHLHGQRYPVQLDHQVLLRARFAAIRWIRLDLTAPFLASRLCASSAARRQSSWSACASRSRSTRCSRSHTPAACQSRQATPTGYAAATTHLSGQQAPGNACFKHKDDPAQSRTTNNPRPPTLTAWRSLRQQGLINVPQLITHANS
jgi:hypothetical protein